MSDDIRTFASAEELHKEFLRWRGLRDYFTPCADCHGSGRRTYSNTSGWRGGMGGASMTVDVCDKCWGSGTPDRPGEDLRSLYANIERRIKEESVLYLAKSVGAGFASTRGCIEEVISVLEKLGRSRSRNQPFIRSMTDSFISTLRAGIVAASTPP